jgi:hypothetical protein
LNQNVVYKIEILTGPRGHHPNPMHKLASSGVFRRLSSYVAGLVVISIV